MIVLPDPPGRPVHTLVSDGLQAELHGAGRFFKQCPPNLYRIGAALDDMRHMLGKGQSESVPVDLNAVAAEAVAPMGSDAGMRRIVLEMDLAPVNRLARGDAVTLQQVIMNLVSIAMESMPPVEIGGALTERKTVVWGENREEGGAVFHVMLWPAASEAATK